MSPLTFFVNLLDAYAVFLETPSIATYQRLRITSGLSAKNDAAAHLLFHKTYEHKNTRNNPCRATGFK